MSHSTRHAAASGEGGGSSALDGGSITSSAAASSPADHATVDTSSGAVTTSSSSSALSIGGGSSRLKWLSLIALVGQNCTAVLLMSVTQRFHHPDKERYSPAAVVLMTELVKLLFCAGTLVRTLPSTRDVATEIRRDFVPLVVPAFLFALQNNLLFVALSNLEATLFQVTYQMKLLCTAMLMVVMLGKQLSVRKWTALVVLFAGIVLTQVDASKKDRGQSGSLSMGLTAVTICALSSGFASVYFEKVLKNSTTSLIARNVQLSILSLIIMLAVFGTETSFDNLLVGFDWMTWVLVVNQAVGGLLVAMVMKYADNILKGFATAAAIVVSGVVSAAFLDLSPSRLFVFGAVLVLAATYLYSAVD